MMRVLSSLLTKLQGEQAPCLFVGVRQSDGSLLLVIDLLRLTQHADGTFKPHAVAEHLLPHGLSYVGVWAPTQAVAQQLMQDSALLLVPSSSSQPVTCALACGEPASPAWQRCTLQRSQPTALDLGAAEAAEVVPDEAGACLGWLAANSLTVIRVRATLQLNVYAPAECKPDAMQAAISRGFQQLEEQLQDSGLVFVLSSSDGTSCLASASSPGALADLKGSCQAPVEAQAMCQPSASPCPAPVLEYRPVEPVGGAVQQHTCSLELHALAYVPSTQPQSSLGQAALRPALLAQLRALQAAAQAAGKVQRGQAQHFLPPGRNHHIVLCYPVVKADPEMNEAALAPLRKELHAALGLPLDRPALKATNALLWQQLGTGNTDSGAGASERLQDVHQELALPGPRESVHLVQGSYDYHHYMQDRFDDSGWGCAYRSLQTICSWFRLQGYTSKPSPGHREIQSTLVKLGDKDPSFIGSNQWIGAIELSYILDDYLGVTSKIITINRGADIPSHARELVAHFKSQGTPIMIGGGVLAYTLLGVYFNESTGDCAFLILDPHYTGTEVLSRIHKGTWVGWKRPGESAAAGGPLFVQDAFYNFLCPQRPKEV